MTPRQRHIKRIAINIRIRVAWLKIYAPGWSARLGQELAGMSVAQWSGYQSGKSGRVPTIEVQERIKYGLGLSGYWLDADPETILAAPVPEVWQ
jgi:hypothetical protein